jgi:hypothetical protein
MLMSGLAGMLSSLEWVPTFLFVVLAVIYFLLPVLGHRKDQRGDLLLAMYLLVAYDGLTLANGLVQYLMALSSPGGPAHGAGPGASFHITALIGIVKSGLFIGAKILTITCLKSLEAPARRVGLSGSSPEIDLSDAADPDHEASREFARAVQLNNQHHRDQAVALLQQIIANYPNSQAAAKARSALRKLGG